MYIYVLYTVIPLRPQLDAPADPHAVPHEVPGRRLKEGLSLHTDGETQDSPAAAGVHAGGPPHALWVSSSTLSYGEIWIYSDYISIHFQNCI